jgi:hypothetical protein
LGASAPLSVVFDPTWDTEPVLWGIAFALLLFWRLCRVLNRFKIWELYGRLSFCAYDQFLAPTTAKARPCRVSVSHTFPTAPQALLQPAQVTATKHSSHYPLTVRSLPVLPLCVGDVVVVFEVARGAAVLTDSIWAYVLVKTSAGPTVPDDAPALPALNLFVSVHAVTGRSRPPSLLPSGFRQHRCYT